MDASFDDFLKTYNEKMLPELVENINEEFHDLLRSLDLSDHDLRSPTAQLAMRTYRLAVQQSFHMSSHMLKAYHAFLIERLLGTIDPP